MEKEKKLTCATKNPWESEPNFVNGHIDGIPFIIRRIRTLKHLCGYVGVTENSDLYGKPWEEVEEVFDVHGGVTFAGKIKDYGDIWWLGFDCAHADDCSPGSFFDENGFSSYKTIDFVFMEIINFARQVINLTT